MASAVLSGKHRFAAGGLFALALSQAQLQQRYSTRGFGYPPVIDPPAEPHGEALVSWSLPRSGLLRHVFRDLGIDEKEWAGLESNSVSKEARHHIATYLRLLLEEDEESQKLKGDQVSLAKAVDAAVESAKQEQGLTIPNDIAPKPTSQMAQLSNYSRLGLKDAQAVSRPQKVALLYTLLAACVSDPEGDDPEELAGLGAVKSGYDARHRVTLRLLSLWLEVEWAAVSAMELMVAFMAVATEKELEKQGLTEAKKKSKRKKWKRGGMIGAAAVTGGALLFVTGGLAAPALAAGLEAAAVAMPALGATGLTAAAAVVGSDAIGSTAVASSFGAAGAGLVGKKMARRTRDIHEFEFVPLGSNHQQGRLAVEIAVSGIAFEPDDFVRPWEAPDFDLERYALRWESEVVFAVSTAIQDALKTIWLLIEGTQKAMKEKAMYTLLGGLATAVATPLLALGATNVIDNKWGVALARSEKAGKLLATILLEHNQGKRPVTLTGFALGARMIFICLEELAKHGDEGLGIVERVILLGTPQTLDKARWEAARKVVAGRFVNGFSKNDWVLGVVYRANFRTHRLAGLDPVNVPGIENVDLTGVVDGHASYLTSLQYILQGIDLDSFYAIRPHKLSICQRERESGIQACWSSSLASPVAILM